MRLFHEALKSASVLLALALFVLVPIGCGDKHKSLDGVYQSGGGPINLTIKDQKATVNVGGETKTLDYKVEGNKLIILNTQEGNIEFTINDDGTLTSPFGTLSKSPT
jgi:hypothetical protein